MGEGLSLYIFAIVGYQISARIVELGTQWVIFQIRGKLLSAVKNNGRKFGLCPALASLVFNHKNIVRAVFTCASKGGGGTCLRSAARTY